MPYEVKISVTSQLRLKIAIALRRGKNRTITELKTLLKEKFLADSISFVYGELTFVISDKNAEKFMREQGQAIIFSNDELKQTIINDINREVVRNKSKKIRPL